MKLKDFEKRAKLCPSCKRETLELKTRAEKVSCSNCNYEGVPSEFANELANGYGGDFSLYHCPDCGSMHIEKSLAYSETYGIGFCFGCFGGGEGGMHFCEMCKENPCYQDTGTGECICPICQELLVTNQ
jgi:hypothetical protein